MSEYTQAVCHDGAAILRDGEPMTPEEIIKALRTGEREAAGFRAMCEAFERLEQIVGLDTGGGMGPGPALNAVEIIAKGLSFSRLRLANVTRQQEWPGYDQTDTTFKTLEVCGEAGELAEAVKKMVRAERGIAGSTAKLEAVADELGDVVISADLLAAHLGIDLADATVRKFDKTSVKYGLVTRLTTKPSRQAEESTNG